MLRERGGNTGLLFHLLMHSLVGSCLCPAQGSTQNLGTSGWCSNQLGEIPGQGKGTYIFNTHIFLKGFPPHAGVVELTSIHELCLPPVRGPSEEVASFAPWPSTVSSLDNKQTNSKTPSNLSIKGQSENSHIRSTQVITWREKQLIAFIFR